MPTGKIGKVIEHVKGLPGRAVEGVKNTFEDFKDTAASLVDRHNVLNAIMPGPFGGMANSLIDFFSNDKKSGARGTPNVGLPNPTNPDDNEDDLLSELIEVVDDGFEEANTSLDSILKRIRGGSNVLNASTANNTAGGSNVLNTSTANNTALLGSNSDELVRLLKNADDSLVELFVVSDDSHKLIKQIEKNTHVDDLTSRENEIEARQRRLTPSPFTGTSTNISEPGADISEPEATKSGGLFSMLANGVLNYLGLRSLAGKATGGLKGAAGYLGKSVTKMGGLANSAIGAVKPLASVGIGKIASGIGNIAPGIGKAIGGVGKTLGGMGSRLLGAPLALGMGAYESYNVSKDQTMSSDTKTVEYSKIGGKTAGALAGAQAGATIGAIGGPVGIAIGGLLGGIGGYFLGEQGGEVVGNLINSITPSKAQATTNAIKGQTNQAKATTQAATKAANHVKPNIAAVSAGSTKINNLRNLTTQIDQSNATKTEMAAAPQVVPVTINNQNTTNSTSANATSRTSVPNVRNQDGTIQRLLDANYSPLLS